MDYTPEYIADLDDYYKSALTNQDDLTAYWNHQTSLYLNGNYPVFQAGLLHSDPNIHLSLLANRVFRHLPTEGHILDAGCGIGTTSLAFSKLHPGTTYTGLTISPAQVTIANELKDKNDAVNTTYLEASYTDTGLPDNTFDAALFMQSMGYALLDDVFPELHRITKPNAKIFIQDMFQKDECSIYDSRNLKVIHRVWGYLCYPLPYFTAKAKQHGFTVHAIYPDTTHFYDFTGWQRLYEHHLKESHPGTPWETPIKTAEIVLTRDD